MPCECWMPSVMNFKISWTLRLRPKLGFNTISMQYLWRRKGWENRQISVILS